MSIPRSPRGVCSMTLGTRRSCGTPRGGVAPCQVSVRGSRWLGMRCSLYMRPQLRELGRASGMKAGKARPRLACAAFAMYYSTGAGTPRFPSGNERAVPGVGPGWGGALTPRDRPHALSCNILMLKTFQYRLYPNRQQRRLLDQQLEECRWLYNHLLAERRDAWEQRQESLRYYEQATNLPALKAERPMLASVHSQVLQNVALRLDLAFKAFFRRCKAGEQPGYPRFRGKGRYDSLTFPQVPAACKLDADTRRVLLHGV